MDRDEILLQEDKNFIKGVIRKIFGNKPKDFKRELIKAIDIASKEFKAQGNEKEIMKIINKGSGLKLSSLTDLKKTIHLIESEEGEDGEPLNEGSFSDWWQEAKGSAYGALSFYPMLTMFLELDKVIKNTGGASIQTTVIYFLVWVLVVTGKIEHKEIIKRSKDKKWKNLSGNPYGIE